MDESQSFYARMLSEIDIVFYHTSRTEACMLIKSADSLKFTNPTTGCGVMTLLVTCLA